MDFSDLVGYFFVSIIVVMIVVSLALLPIGFLFNDIGGSSGQHSGYVTAVEFNDNIFFDSTLVYFKTSRESTQEDVYCVNDASLKGFLEAYASEGDQVTITFSNPFWFWRSLCNGGSSIIIGVLSYG